MARQEGFTIAQILSWLNEEGIKISRSKLYQYLKGWDAQVQRRALTDEQIHGSVLPLAQRTLLSDTKIARRLTEDLGIDTSSRQVRRARTRYRAIKRFEDPIKREVHRQRTTQRVKELILRGGGILHGRRWAISHLRAHLGHRALQEDVATVMRAIDP